MPWQPSKLCVSILPASLDHVWELLENCARADIIELRLDYLGMIPFREVIKRAGKPLIITLRLSQEEGYWKGTETERAQIFQKAVYDGVDYVDIEWKSAPRLLNQLTLSSKTALIISHHIRQNKPEKLKKTFSIKIHGPKNPFKTKNPYKSDED